MVCVCVYVCVCMGCTVDGTRMCAYVWVCECVCMCVCVYMCMGCTVDGTREISVAHCFPDTRTLCDNSEALSA